jgi:hypothetical protein
MPGAGGKKDRLKSSTTGRFKMYLNVNDFYLPGNSNIFVINT